VTTNAESGPQSGALPLRAGATTLAGLVAHRASETPDALLVTDDRDRCLTALEFQQEAARVAAHLAKLNVFPGQLVSWIMPTGIDALLVMVGLSTVGAVQNPIIPMYGPREIGHIFREAGVDAVVSVKSHRSMDYERMINDLVAPASQGPRVVAVEQVLGRQPVLEGAGERGTCSHVAATGARWVFYTSGSTGLPKGVLHTDATLYAVAHAMADRLKMTPSDRSGIAFPIAHIGGPINLMAALVSGSALILLEKFEPREACDVLARHGVTMAGSGTAFHLGYLDVQAERPGTPLFPMLRCCPGGGAPKPAGLHDRVKEALGGAGIVSGWGLTEAPVLTMGSPDDPDLEMSQSEGQALEGVHLKVAAADGSEALPGQPGELRAKAPQTMLGYVDAELDREAFDDEGYLRTGDLGTVDSSGFVRITGRLKDVVIRNGENVSTAEVEILLGAMDAIADAAVIGLPDDRTGERVCAVIETAPGSGPLDVRAVSTWLAARGLRRIAWPEQVECVASLPRTPAGKVDKTELVRMFSC
jgi:acyl-CoA synthetase (AMP-forming)/AMP-acid ligase II